jgi:hypothetical protein
MVLTSPPLSPHVGTTEITEKLFFFFISQIPPPNP